jgi:uncharacterized repeat protein (TIGR02543 family)
MKKLLFLVFVSLTVFLLIGCQDEKPTPSEPTVNYTVTFNTNGGTSVAEISVEEGQVFTEPTPPSREGYTFSGWFLTETFDEGTAFIFTSVITENITLYAKWIEIILQSTITFDTVGGSSIEPITQNVGSAITAPEAPVKEGNVFVGWVINPAISSLYQFDTMPAEDFTLYAVWHPLVTINFESNGGSIVDSITDLALAEVEIPEEPTREDYQFAGWYTDLDLTELFTFDAMPDEDITLYAKWEEIPPTDEELIAMDLALLEFSEAVPITTSMINLPSRGENGTTFTWTSSDETALTRTGVVIPNPIGGVEKMVTLSLRARNGSVTNNYTFDLVIPAKVESVITDSITLPFESLTEEYEVAEGFLLTYFVDGGNVPYVNLYDFMTLLDGFIYSDEISYDFDVETQVLTLSYTVLDDKDTEDPDDDEEYFYEAFLNFIENTVTVETTSFFSNYIYSTSTDFSSGLTYLDEYYFEPGDPVIYDLNAYRFDMIYSEGAYILPFNIVNLLFTGSSYYNLYYNGDGYKGIYAFGGDVEEFKTSSFNGVTMPADMRLATFDAYAFTLDYFYGLKKVNGVETYYDHLYPRANTLLGRTNATITGAYSDFVLEVLDELHSSMIYSSFYRGAERLMPSISLLDIGPRYLDWYQTYQAVSSGITARWGSEANIPAFRVIDGTNTAVIYLDGFKTKTVDDDESVVDSNDYMRDAINGILLANPNIENIVVDLSYNTGGNLGALYRVLGYITDNPIASNYQNPLTNMRQTYWLEVDTVATPVNWFFMTSKVTFSAANLMAAIGKYQGIATVIGTTSGGGASSIIPIILPDGSMHQISSLNVLSYRVGSDVDGWEYFSLEYGVEPDYILPVSSLTDDAAIAALIDQINSENTD